MNDAKPVVHHNHITRDIKRKGLCPACDGYWASAAGKHRHHFELDAQTGWHCQCGEFRPLDYRGELARPAESREDNQGTARAVLDGIKAEAAKANPNGAEWEALTDPGDRKTAPAWIVDADDLEIRMEATYAAGKAARFIASAPGNIERLTNALEAVLALHKEVEGYRLGAVPGAVPDYPVCSTCFTDDEFPAPYPCPTVAAVEGALIKDGQ